MAKKVICLFLMLVVSVSSITVLADQGKGKALGHLDKDEKYYYKEGERYGREDRKAGRSSDYRRYSRYVPSKYLDEFSKGYSAGYGVDRDHIIGGKIRSQEDEYYNRGFRRGSQDYRDGRSQDYRRYSREYDSSYEREFRRGYNDGYNIREDRDTGSDDSNSKAYYDRGFRYGKDDARDGRRSDYRRYSREYTNRYEDTFRKGYEKGYEQGREIYKDNAKEAYDQGYQRGREDYRANRSRDYTRYRRDYDPRYESDFRNGYNAGYGSRYQPPNIGSTSTGQRAYDRGYDLGREEYRMGRTRDYTRYRNEYNSSTEEDFRRGYNDGYSGKSRR